MPGVLWKAKSGSREHWDGSPDPIASARHTFSPDFQLCGLTSHTPSLDLCILPTRSVRLTLRQRRREHQELKVILGNIGNKGQPGLHNVQYLRK